MRGNLARTQINKIIIIKPEIKIDSSKTNFKNTAPIKILKKAMFLYSLKKKKMKLNLPYSVLNPETSSDSPSLKSKGERFKSIKAATPHRKKGARNPNIKGTIL